MSSYTIGIDTGGTYTDAVIIDAKSHVVVASAKALTTKGDLAIGVSEALEKVLTDAGEAFDRNAISLVSLSTTLATNALVEGHGSSVGVILIGFDDGMTARTNIAKAVPSAQIVRVDGGHVYTGQEQHPLDVEAIEAALNGDAGSADAYAVASHYSVRNPNHERRAEELIRSKTGCPVTASCDLSDALDGPRRALTATFNARIISLIVALENAVRSSMQALGIDAQIMIVKGDGSIATAESVIAKPIETILSGPAASVIGARFLANKSDFIISDIGGTTSDVATVRNGWPSLNEQGSDVGGFRTLVRAIDMQTVGLGGDSEVDIDFKGGVSLRNNRVVPVSLIANRWPHILTQMTSALAETGGMRGATNYLVFPEGASAGVFPEDLTDADRRFLERLDPEKPVLYGDVVFGAADRSRVPKLVDRGVIQISGFTPSDAAHVLGLQSQWSVKGARLVCELMGRATGKVSGAKVEEDVVAFAQEVHDAVAAKSARLLLERLTGTLFRDDDPLVEAVTTNVHRVGDVRITMTPEIDIIAVGGPASVFYPAVGERLGIDVIIPSGAEVANAIGAAIGLIKVRAVVEITRTEGGGYLIHSEGEPQASDSSQRALEIASEAAREIAQREAKLMGGSEVEIDVSIKRIDIPGLSEDISLVAATVTAEVVSAPDT
ncbi:MAG: hydantoinase/oxoprolinase family protein [Pseudomonadota bacterium]